MKCGVSRDFSQKRIRSYRSNAGEGTRQRRRGHRSGISARIQPPGRAKRGIALDLGSRSLIAAKKVSPLVVGRGPMGFTIASDALALHEHATEIMYLEDTHLIHMTRHRIDLFDRETLQRIPDAMDSAHAGPARCIPWPISPLHDEGDARAASRARAIGHRGRGANQGNWPRRLTTPSAHFWWDAARRPTRR